MPAILQKVTAFITRLSEAGPELLVFRHPTSGIQLPAGTVEEGESPEAAVLREVEEETGLANLRLVGPLAVIDRTLPRNNRVLLRDTALRIGPSDRARDLDFVLGRGAKVRLAEVIGDSAEVIVEEFNSLTQNLATLAARISGWIPADLLAAQTERYCFHLATSAVTPGEWDHYTEDGGGHVFHCYWTPLVPKPKLVSPQDAWLDRVYEPLLASARA